MLQTNKVFHKPALLKEAIEFLNIKPGEVYIDATVGGGGHTEAILKKGGRVVGIDFDPAAIEFTKERLKKACPNASWQIIKANFIDLKKIAGQLGIINHCAGIIFDLGTSFNQLTSKERGFSFSHNEILDMRMDPDLKVRAVDLINGLGKKELYELFIRLGEEKLALPIAQAIILARKRESVRYTGQLAEIAVNVYCKRKIHSQIHPATKIFQALRIAINDELNNIRKALPEALAILQHKGRLVIISFHGLEDRIVKEFFKEEEIKGRLKILTKKPVVPTMEEKLINSRCRSAKLRCGEKYER